MIIFCNAVLIFSSTCYPIFSYNKRSAAKESHHLPQVNEEQIMVFLIFVLEHQKFGIQFIKILIKTTSFNRFEENIKIELRNY